MDSQLDAGIKIRFDQSRALRDNEQLILEEGLDQGGLSSPVNQMKEPEDGFGEACFVTN